MYTKQFVAFIDILGFKEIIETKSFDEVNSIYEEFRKMSEQTDIRFRQMIWHFKNELGMPAEERFEFSPHRTNIMFFSDCVVWTHNLDELPEQYFLIIVSELISALSLLYSVLLAKGILIRGGITIGDIYIDGKKVLGPGLVKAYQLEGMAKYPRIVIDSNIIQVLKQDLDEHYKLLIDTVSVDANEDRFFYIDHFKMIEKNAEIRNRMEGEELKGLDLPKHYIDAIINVIPQGINHQSPRVREKYAWLRTGLLQMKGVQYDLAILMMPTHSYNESLIN